MTKIAAPSHSGSRLSGFASIWRKGAIAAAVAIAITGLLPASALASGPNHLILSPATATIAAGDSQAYTAEGYDGSDADLGDVTAGTTFTVDSGASCTGATCTSDTPGDYTVTGTDGTATGTATLHVTSAAAGDWTSWHNDPANTGFNSSETTISAANVSNLDIAWSASAPMYGNAPAVVADGVVYVAGFDGVLRAYAAGCGAGRSTCSSPLWIAYMGDGANDAASDAPTVVDGVVYVGTWGLKFEAFDAAGVTGCSGTPKVCTPLWRAAVDGRVESSPAVAGGTVYFTSSSGTLYAFAAGCNSGGGTCSPIWKATVPLYTVSSPAVADGVVYVGGRDGNVYAFSVGCAVGGGTCSPLWIGNTGAPQMDASPVVGNGEVYVGGSDGYLYTFDVGCASGGGTCTPAWKAHVGESYGPWIGSPATADGVVYISGYDNFYAFAAACGSGGSTCTPNWTAAIPVGTTPAIANGIVYVGSVTGDLSAAKLYALAVGCASGGGACTPVWSHLVPSGVATAPTVSHGAVYIGADNGSLDAFELYAGVSHITLSPASSTITTAGGQLYAAQAFDASDHLAANVADDTVFTIDGGGSCTGAICTSDIPGDHTITATYDTRTATATLHVTSAATGDWPSWHNDPANTGFNPAETTISAANVSNLDIAWSAAAGGFYGGAPAVVAGGVVYVAGWDGVLRAYAAGCGTGGSTCSSPLWTAEMGNSASDAPTVVDGVVYVGTWDGKMLAFDAAAVTGCSGSPTVCTPLWTANVDGRVYATPTVTAGTVYFTTSGGTLYAFAAGCNSGGGTCSPIWKGNVSAGTSSSPAVADGVVYVGGYDGHLYAFSVGCAVGGATCGPLWIGNTGASYVGSAAVGASGKVYVGASDGYLYAFNVGCASSGGTCTPAWKANVGGGYGAGTPATANGVVYVSGNTTFYAFAATCGSDGSTCTPTWTAAIPAAKTAAIANGIVYVSSAAGDPSAAKLYALAVGCAGGGDTCTPLWSHLLPDGADTAPIVSHGAVYVGARDGNVYAFELFGGLPGLILSPADSTAFIGSGQAYTAAYIDGGNSLGDVTTGTVLTIDGGGTCDNDAHTCTAGAAGRYTVTGTHGSVIATAVLRMTDPGDWPQFHNGPAHTGDNPAETTISAANVGGLEMSWEASIGSDQYSAPAVVDGVVYVGTSGDQVEAFPANCGTGGGTCSPLWRGITSGAVASSPAVVDGVVYALDDTGRLYAFAVGCATNGESCAPLWTADIGAGGLGNSPTVAGGVVYVASGTGTLYAFAVGCSSGGGTCTPTWTAAVAPPYRIWSSPTVSDGLVFVAASNGFLAAYEVGCATGGGTCSPVWTAVVGAMTLSTPSVANGVVYVGSSDGNLDAFDEHCATGGGTCTPIWTAQMGAIESSPAVADGVVYVGSKDDNVYAFAVGCGSGGSTCTPLWIGPTGSLVTASPAVANGVVYAGSWDGSIYAFKVGCATGGAACEPLWTARTNYYVAAPPAVSNGALYFGSADGYLYAYALTVDTLVLSPANTKIQVGGSQTYTAEGYNRAGYDMGDVTASTTFEIFADAPCVGNVCTFATAGDPIVRGMDGLAMGMAYVEVDGPVDHIVMSPADSTVLAHQATAFSAEGFDSANHDLGNVTADMTFTVSGDASCAGSSCTPNAAGDFTVTGADGHVHATAMLRVDGPIDHLRLAPANGTVAPGGSETYTAAASDRFNHDLGDVTGSTSFTIDSGGACPDRSCSSSVVGIHTVTATDGSATGRATLRVISGGDWPQARNDPSHQANNTVETTLSASTLRDVGVVWTSPTGAIVGSPVVSDGVVYVGSFDGNLYAFAAGCGSDGSTCAPLWFGHTGDLVISTAAVADGIVYVGSGDGNLYAFAVGCASGGGLCTPVWVGPTGAGIESSPAVADGVVYVGSADTKLYAFAVGCATGGDSCTPLWTGSTGDQIGSSPAVAAGVVYVGSEDGSLYAFAVGCASDGAACSPLWTGTTTGSIDSSPAVAGGVVYVGSSDGSLYAFAAGCATGGDTCTPVWTAPMGGNVESSPAVADGVVYVSSEVGELDAFAVGCASGGGSCTPIWRGPTGGGVAISSPSVANGIVYMGSGDGLLYAFAVGCASGGDTCSPVWTANTGGPEIFSSPAISRGVIYVASYSGKMVAFGLTTGPVDHLVVTPASATITAGGSQVYSAEGFDADGHDIGDVTSVTTFDIGGVACAGSTCASTAAGDHTVTGTDVNATGSTTLTVGAAALSKLVITGPATADAGIAGLYTVKAEDAYGNIVTGYAGVVTVTSSDTAMTSTVAAAMAAGTGTFNVTFHTAGSQTVAATDTTFTSDGLPVTVGGAAVATKLVVSGPTTATVGGAQDFTVTAEDGSNATVTTYTGTVTITSSDGAFTATPASGTLTNGVGTFSVTFGTAASQTVSAHDDGSLVSNDLSVTVGTFGAAAHLVVAGPATATAGIAQDFTVTAKDAYGNTVTDYAGDVTITSSDGAFASAPSHGTLTSGTGTFSVTLKTAGSQTVAAGDGTPSHDATPVSVAVVHAALNKLVVAGPSTIIRGLQQDYTVTAADTFGNPVTDYAGTVTITSSDSAFAGSPASSTLTSGVGTFHVTFHTAGMQTLGAGDGTLTADNLTVTVRVDGTNTYYYVTPIRLLDTRSHNGAVGKLRAGVPVTIQIATRGGIPAGATAITGNVTVVNQTSAGSVYVGPDPIARPSTATVTFSKSEIAPVGITMGLSATGTLSATYAASGTTDLVIDVTGYFMPDGAGATYHPLTPARLLDSRNGNGFAGKLKVNAPRTFTVIGRGGVPSNAVAVTGNVTVTGASNGWAVYLGPDPLVKPAASTINFARGETRANNVTVALSTGGSLSATFLSSKGSTTNLVFDVTGYYTADLTGLKFVPVTPTAVLNTGTGLGLSGKLSANTPRTLPVLGHAGVPNEAVGIAGLVTAVNQTNGWAIFVGPIPVANPPTSSLNFVKGETMTNGLTVALSSGGSLGLTYIGSKGNSTNVILTVTGYFVPIPPG
jgi:outer membrane protein assembly factor BamB